MHILVFKAAQAPPPEPEPAAPSQPQAQAQQTRPAGQSAPPAKPARPAPSPSDAPQSPQNAFSVPAEHRDRAASAAAQHMLRNSLPATPYNNILAFNHSGNPEHLTAHLPAEQAPGVHNEAHMIAYGAGLNHPNCKCRIVRSEDGATPDRMETLPSACQQCRDAAARFNAEAVQRAAGQESDEEAPGPESPESAEVDRAEAEEATEALELAVRPCRHLLIVKGSPRSFARRFRVKPPKLRSLPRWPVPKAQKPASPNSFVRVDLSDPKHSEFIRQALAADEEAKARLRPAQRFIVLRWRG